jgi:hypothetical protein
MQNKRATYVEDYDEHDWEALYKCVPTTYTEREEFLFTYDYELDMVEDWTRYI